jgi:hypothetical protein
MWRYRSTHTRSRFYKGMRGQRQAPVTLPQRKRPRTHRTRGWVDLGVGLHGSGKSRRHRRSKPTVLPVASCCTDCTINLELHAQYLREKTDNKIKANYDAYLEEKYWVNYHTSNIIILQNKVLLEKLIGAKLFNKSLPFIGLGVSLLFIRIHH